MTSEHFVGFGAAPSTDARTQLAAQAELIHARSSGLEHSRRIFDRASQAARIGVWECSLPDQTLVWTDVVYDIFDLPRGMPVTREETLALYTPTSARELTSLRSRAIAEGSGFALDVAITTRRGASRWIRITATVEREAGRPVRIFGMKQDITEEKILLERTRYLADFDPLTGLANRNQFQTHLSELSELEGTAHGLGALLLVDLDGFKAINDTCGHAVGDVCLRAAATRLQLACAEAALVARIGGDEFAILVGAGLDRSAVARMARRIVAGMAEPLDHLGRSLKLGASVGVAFVEGGAPDYLFTRADTALYAAKAAGRGTYRISRSIRCFGPRGMHAA